MIVEMRVPMPMTLDEFDKGWLYMAMKASEEASEEGDSGVVILKNEPYDNTDGHLGTSEKSGNLIPKNKGQYTLKQYFLGSKLPGWLTYILPRDSMYLTEESWNAFPECLTILTSNYMSHKKTRIFVKTSFRMHDNGKLDNPHGLTAEELKERVVHTLDISAQDKNDKDYKAKYDPSLVRCEKAGRGPLKQGWIGAYQGPPKAETSVGVDEKKKNGNDSDGKGPAPLPMMTAYKLIRADFKVWGLQTKTENTIINSQLKLFLRTHGQAFCTLDDYQSLSMEDIRKLEAEAKKKLETLREIKMSPKKKSRKSSKMDQNLAKVPATT